MILLCAAAYSIGRIVYAIRTRRQTDYEVDASDSLMGISMAGMLIPGLGIVTPGPSTVSWICLWIFASVWFAVSVVRRVVGNSHGRTRRHHLPHFVFSAAMVYMLAAGAAAHTSAGMGTAGRVVPFVTLDLLFLLFMVGYSVLGVDRLSSLSIAGNRPVATADPTGSAATPTAATTSVLAPSAPAPTVLATALFAPRLAAATNIVMAISMGYMLTMMLG